MKFKVIHEFEVITDTPVMCSYSCPHINTHEYFPVGEDGDNYGFCDLFKVKLERSETEEITNRLRCDECVNEAFIDEHKASCEHGYKYCVICNTNSG